MGWWNQSREGVSLQTEDTGLMWGDSVADLLDEALAEIVNEFQQGVGRDPTKAEIRAGLEFSLMGGEDDDPFPAHPQAGH